MLPLRLPAGDPPRLLLLGAHADDIEIGCGGTVLRLIAEHPGLSIRWIVFSGNEVRAREARASAAAFLQGVRDAEVTLHRFRDGFFPFAGAAIKDEFERLKTAFAPTLILTHYKHDAHQDHRLVCDLTYNTWRDHLILEYEIPKMEGDIGNPNLFVPLVRDQGERKIALILEHFASQRGRSWFAAETFEAMLRLRGINAGSPSGWAEGFYVRRLVL